eukprot:TRINITY_DN1583_c0_g6_i1.p1 TRINITY_DN1583_c0_g6~~TRINITY_DN1583_c0_g6_i1.p1  ORF type:complete len:264 (-),score=58.63 TRINITY_DN1583_c0_g6_i1:842-1633(-)
MGESFLLHMIHAPVCTSLSLLCLTIFYLLNKRQIPFDDVGLQFERIRDHKEYWRFVSSALSHYSVIHLIMNGNSLWELSFLEVGMGSWAYLECSFMVFCFTSVIFVLCGWAIRSSGTDFLQRHVDAFAVGYSGVLFGLMTIWSTILSLQSPDLRMHIFGLFSVPMWASPIVSLVMTQVLVPRASFLGHAAGIGGGFWYIMFWKYMPSIVGDNLGLIYNIEWCVIGVSLGFILWSYFKRPPPSWSLFERTHQEDQGDQEDLIGV